jgi:DNA polymerase-1
MIIDVSKCQACHIGLHQQGGKAVPGIGNEHADLMIIGEAPGKDEAQMGIPFIGLSGKALDEMLKVAGLRREDVYITNIAKCWPYEQTDANGVIHNANRAPNPTEITNCKRFLDAEIASVNPKVIITLGNVPLSAIEGKDNAHILSRRGQPFLYKRTNIFVMPTLHPSYVLRNGGVWKTLGKELTPTASNVVDDLKEAINLSLGKITLPQKRYRLVDSKTTLLTIRDAIKSQRRCTFDIETTGLTLKDKVVGIGMAIDVAVSCYIPFLIRDAFNDEPIDYWEDKDINREEVISVLKEILEDEAIEKSAHNAKFDMGILQTDFNICVKGLGWDTMCGAYLIDENSEHDLKTLKDRYIDLLGYEDQWNDITKGGSQALNAPLDIIFEYCCSDADATYRLTREQKILFQSLPNYQWLMDNFYVPIMYIVKDMEINGVAYDKDTALKVREKLLIEQTISKDKIYKELPEAGKFNIDSDDQVRKVLYGVMGLKAPFETKGKEKGKGKAKPKKVEKKVKPDVSTELDDALSDFGSSFEDKQSNDAKGSTDKKALEILAKENPIVKEIVNYRHCGHIITTYIDGRIKILDEFGRVHIAISPTGAVSGRFSAKGSQNVPKDPMIKGLHVAPPGSKLVSVDLSQAEVRCLAHYAKEEGLRKEFEKGIVDVHSVVASLLAGETYDNFLYKVQVLKDPVAIALRSAAKSVTFGIIYGMGINSLAVQIKKSVEESQALTDFFFQKFGNTKTWIASVHADASKTGVVTNIFGRVRHLPMIFSDKTNLKALAERQAVNSIIQSTAADITNLALIKISRELKRQEIPAKIVLQVHDNIVSEAPDEYVESVKTLMLEIMEAKPHPAFTVKMAADADVYQAWGVH